VPSRYGKFTSLHTSFSRWRADGTLERVLRRLRRDLEAAGLVDAELWCIDGSSVRAGRAAAGARKKGGPAEEPADHALGRSRGGFGTKIHLITDGGGIPLVADVSSGERHESTYFERTMSAARMRVGHWPEALAGDKGYSYPRIRRWLAQRKIEDVIARRSDQRTAGDEAAFARDTYRRRNVIERCIGWLKECRRIATRFEKLAVNFLAMLEVAMMQRYLRLLDAS
jgi:transposase